jgi:hypothetical protein
MNQAIVKNSSLENKMKNKWYSEGLTEKDVKSLEKRYAKIKRAEYGINERIGLSLTITLDLETGHSSFIITNDQKDIYNLLKETRAINVNNLEGKIIETFLDRNLIKTISVNENLI